MLRDEIIGLIREHYDPEPKDWPRHRGWDDGAGEIADKILSLFNPVVNPVEGCPECGLKADTLLHKFCTHRYCPTRGAAVPSQTLGTAAVSRPEQKT